jgi:outer membrane protein assembly factor BamB/adenine/guanine phosphoribosyltransferase-like PRPP-binding protein
MHEKIKQRIAAHIKSFGLVTSERQPIIDPNGMAQAWLLDLRPTLLDPQCLDDICEIFWDKFASKLPFQIGGMETAAVPLVVALGLKARQKGLQINTFIIRKERKTSGLGKSIEGIVTDAPIVLVDDILNSGNSLEKARAVLEQEGHKIREIFVVVDYRSQNGIKWRSHWNYPVTSIFSLEDFGLKLGRENPPLKISYKILWRHYEKGAYPFHIVPKSGPVIVNERLYMGTSAGKMLCLDLHGKLVWEFQAKAAEKTTKGIFSNPAIHDGKLYFGAYNGIVYCLDAATGKEIWQNPVCDWIGSSPLLVPELGMLFIGLEYESPRRMGSNAALKMDSGNRVWETPQKRYQHGSAAYYAPKNLVVFGNADHEVTAYNAGSGHEVWKMETKRSIKYPPAIDPAKKLVATSSFDGNIYIQDVETGELKAAIQTDDICYATPLFAGNKVFCGSGDKHLYVIDADDFHLIEKKNFHSRILSSPKQIGNNVVFGTNGGVIIEMDMDTLEIAGRAQLPDAVTNAVAVSVDQKILYARTHMDELYAIERNYFV